MWLDWRLLVAVADGGWALGLRPKRNRHVVTRRPRGNPITYRRRLLRPRLEWGPLKQATTAVQ